MDRGGDDDVDSAKMKGCLVLGGLLAIAFFMSFDELIYLISGHETAATITKAYTTTSRSGATSTTVEYNWTEPDGTHRRDMTNVEDSWRPPSDGKVAIRYTAGETGRSRLVGRVAWGWIMILGGAILATVGFAIWLSREVADEDRRTKEKEKQWRKRNRM